MIRPTMKLALNRIIS